jgi:hypothetical protein
VGILLGGAGLGALAGMRRVDVEQAKVIENRMDEVKRMLEGREPVGGPAVHVPDAVPAVPVSAPNSSEGS